MKISLTNLRELPLTFVLMHDIFCACRKACACLTALAPRRRVPSVLSVAPGQTVRGLPSAILSLPQVERAIARGRLRLVRTP